MNDALLVLLVLGPTTLYYVLARRRGESRFWATLFAVLLGPFALPLLLLPPAPSRTRTKTRTRDP